MQKKQDGKTPQLKSDVGKLVTKLEQELNDWEKSLREITKNLITLGSTAQEVWITYPRKWYLNTLTELDNLRDINMSYINYDYFKALGNMYNCQMMMNVPTANVEPVKQETTMWYNSEEHPTAQSKNYFLKELNNIVSKKLVEASKRFGMNDPYPKDYTEAIEWLKAGKFKIDPVLLDAEYFNVYRLIENLEWTDDTIVRDEENFKAYSTRLSTETKRIERIIVACRLEETDYDYDRDGDCDYNVTIDALEMLEQWDWTPPAKVIPLPSTTETEVAIAA